MFSQSFQFTLQMHRTLRVLSKYTDRFRLRVQRVSSFCPNKNVWFHVLNRKTEQLVGEFRHIVWWAWNSTG